MAVGNQRNWLHYRHLLDSDDECKDEEVSPEDDWSLTEGEGDLEATLRALQTRTEATSRPTATDGARRPEAVDDFLRNFLLQTGMTRTLDCFQTEWAEMVQGELVDAAEVGVVPDVYTDNQRLDTELKSAQREREDYRLAASAAAPALVKVQRARDLHRLQHKRVVQERTRSPNLKPAIKGGLNLPPWVKLKKKTPIRNKFITVVR
uniref:Sperm-associated antigen 16 protein n=1 Tax=Scophthalmus maximus TaxID=52904 RepID=A0A8D3B6V6_SCOMX